MAAEERDRGHGEAAGRPSGSPSGPRESRTDRGTDGSGTRGPRPLAVIAAALASAVVGWVVFAPSLDFPLHTDDWLHLAFVQDHEVLPERGFLDLYALADAGEERMGPVQGDYVPWWRADDLLLHFLRPLSSLTYHVDHALHGTEARGYYRTNLILYAATIAAAVTLYAALARRSGRGALTVLLAGVLFAAMREHEENVVWIAGRYSLVSAIPGILALLAYHRWRSGGSRRALAGALVLYGLALLGSEMAAAIFAFFIAYELSLARDGLGARLRGIAPVAALLAAWLALYTGLGYGARGTGEYMSPFTEPERFLALLDDRLVKNAMRLVLPATLEPHFPTFSPWAKWTLPDLWAHVAALFLWGALALVAVRDRTVRFVVLGALVALVPLATRVPVARILLVSSIGTSWGLACFAASGLARLRRPRALLLPWNLLHLAAAVCLLWCARQDPVGARARMQLHERTAAGLRERSLELRVPEDPDARVVLVTSPMMVDFYYGPVIRLTQGRGWPGGIWGISATPGTHRLTRTGERSFRLEVDPAELPAGLVPPVNVPPFRDEPIEQGEVTRVGALEIEVERATAGRVHAVEVTIDRPLDDPDVVLVTWERQDWQVREAPAVGESILIRTDVPLFFLPLGEQRPGRAPREPQPR